MHRRNAAERAIHTFKNHVLAGIATCDPQFPIREWGRLLPHAILTLHLMRALTLSYQHIHIFSEILILIRLH